MGGFPCAKAAIDGPANFAAEARAVAVSDFGSEAQQEGAAADRACDGFLIAVQEAYPALAEGKTNEQAVADPQIKAILDKCYALCDWADEIADKRAAANDAHGAARKSKIAEIASDLKGYRADIVKFMRDLITHELAEYGYTPPVTP